MTVVDEPAGPDAGARFRRRLVGGLAASISERGYRATTVADIVGHARTSKRTFYREFADKQDCFVELMRTAGEDLIAHIRTVVDPEAPWQTQVHCGMSAYIDYLDATSAVALSWIRELPALGPIGQAVQRQSLNRLIEIMIEVTDNPGFRRASIPRATHSLATLLVGGIHELGALALEDGRDVHEITETVIVATAGLLTAPGKENLS